MDFNNMHEPMNGIGGQASTVGDFGRITSPLNRDSNLAELMKLRSLVKEMEREEQERKSRTENSQKRNQSNIE